MSSVDMPGAMRLKKPSWKDPRLLVGILLVFASIAGVVALVRAADTSTAVFAAKEDIAVGQPITADRLVAVDVRLGGVESRYIVPGGLADGKVAIQRIAKGDLVPASSLGPPGALGRKPVTINVADALPAEAVAGARVDVWVAAPDGRNGFSDPKLVVAAAEIAHVATAQSAFGGTRETVVQVLVDDARLPQLLGAQANKAKVSVVWNPAAGRAQ
ncbi:SAF domain-containing protein [Sinomonas sp. ASV322]|uniref:SAF domain-containing protein n=1 Tax=Sinomonas sp. ASV322 TaxID=3041920 RepID=UPI0027DE7ACA|nr:SAF domain-containing protein [Sinomonas sp. ASV322]MDQ4503258.1 SAF domain-containing protein [Sinomonas sp. ASV322]